MGLPTSIEYCLLNGCNMISAIIVMVQPGPRISGLLNVMLYHHDVTMNAMASQITSLIIVHSNVYSCTDETKLRVTVLYAGNSPMTGEFPAQRASHAEKCFHLMTSSWQVPQWLNCGFKSLSAEWFCAITQPTNTRTNVQDLRCQAQSLSKKWMN